MSLIRETLQSWICAWLEPFDLAQVAKFNIAGPAISGRTFFDTSTESWLSVRRRTKASRPPPSISRGALWPLRPCTQTLAVIRGCATLTCHGGKQGPACNTPCSTIGRMSMAMKTRPCGQYATYTSAQEPTTGIGVAAASCRPSGADTEVSCLVGSTPQMLSPS